MIVFYEMVPCFKSLKITTEWDALMCPLLVKKQVILMILESTMILKRQTWIVILSSSFSPFAFFLVLFLIPLNWEK